MPKTLTQVIGATEKREFKFPPTPEQQAIIDGAGKAPKVLVVEAGAGTGKTATLEMLATVLPGRGQYTAFNAPLVAESQEKFQGTRVACNTTHSLAFRAVGKDYAHRLGGARIRASQVAEMLGLDDYTIRVGKDDKRLPAPFLASRVILAIRKFCQSADVEINGHHFRHIDGIDMPGKNGEATRKNNRKVAKYLLPYAERAWDDLSDPDGELPFQHDHYVKIWQLGKPTISADYILLDESQDTAPVMLDVLKQQKGMVILVGDSAQQIYEWRGAINAMAAFPDAPRLYLSQSFRFGQAIADIANAVLETLDEKTPLRLKGLLSIPSRIEEVEEPTAILCRTNAVAVANLLGMIAQGKRPFLVGGGKDVVSFVQAAQDLQQGKSTNHPELACFGSWVEVQQYAAMDEGEDLRLMVKLLDTFGCGPILSALKAMPQEEDADLVISTAHKSKGREWDSVKLAPDFPPQSKCGDPERKLLYVAVTRAKLILDVSDCPFFSGDDSIDIETTIAKQKGVSGFYEPPKLPNLVRPKTKEEFTWSKGRNGNWLVRGPVGFANKLITVTRKDGSTSQKRLAKSVWDDGTIAVYSLK